MFDYHEDDCGERIYDYTHGQLKLAWDTIGADSGVDICMRALSKETGAKYGTILFNSIPREDVVYSSSFLMTFLGEAFDKFGKHMPAQPGNFEFAKAFVAVTDNLLAAKKIQPPPVQVGQDGLRGIVAGSQLISDGKVSGCKLVYRIADT